MKKILFIPVIVLVFLSGCWGRSELREVAIVSGLGVDILSPDRIKVTTEILKPGDIRKGKPEPYNITDAEGATVFEAVRDFIITEGKKLLWSHVNVMIIGEETAKKNIVPILGFLLRDHEPRSTMKVFVSEGTAGDMMHVKVEQGPTPMMAISEAIEEQESLSKAPNVEFHEFIQALYSPFSDPYAPIIRGSDKGFQIYGTAIFKENKMVGKLSSKETRGLLRVLDELKGGLQIIQLPSQQESPLYLSLEIKESSTQMKVQIIDNRPKILLKIHETGFIGSETGRLRLNKKQYGLINKLYREAIEREVKQAIQKVQKEYRSSALGFSHLIERQQKEYWNEVKDQWDEIYPSIDVDIKVVTVIPEEGLIKSNVVHEKMDKGAMR